MANKLLWILHPHRTLKFKVLFNIFHTDEFVLFCHDFQNITLLCVFFVDILVEGALLFLRLQILLKVFLYVLVDFLRLFVEILEVLFVISGSVPAALELKTVAFKKLLSGSSVFEFFIGTPLHTRIPKRSQKVFICGKVLTLFTQKIHLFAEVENAHLFSDQFFENRFFVRNIFEFLTHCDVRNIQDDFFLLVLFHFWKDVTNKNDFVDAESDSGNTQTHQQESHWEHINVSVPVVGVALREEEQQSETQHQQSHSDGHTRVYVFLEVLERTINESKQKQKRKRNNWNPNFGRKHEYCDHCDRFT